MPEGSRRRLAPRRRRADDDLEDETSVIGDIDDGSSSDGSIISNDIEGDGTDEEDVNEADTARAKDAAVKTAATPLLTSPIPEGARSAPTFSTSIDTDAMTNGLKISEAQQGQPELDFDGNPASDGDHHEVEQSVVANVPEAPQRETVAQKARREHQEYLRQRDSNPAFVPNRGGFFLHDDRSSGLASWNRGAGRGRGRDHNGVVYNGRTDPFSQPLHQQWAHDLHEPHETKSSLPPQSQRQGATRDASAPLVQQNNAPRREFSFSAVLGAVNVNIDMPGISDPKTFPMLKKKHHVLLPTHRPPLRRDKPVRISIPDIEPSYRFPSTDRSFIFIPRAMRPNQQFGMRGRGRGSFHGSRRPSIMGGSVYTPSVAMSRKSSFGGVRDGRSPAGSVYGRPTVGAMEPARPVVRMPTGGPAYMTGPSPMPYGHPNEPPLQPTFMNGPMSHGVRSTAMPMHQPRPQKAVSISNIETPASDTVRAPQQQSQQPFHQQVPPYMSQAPSEGAAGANGTPLSHIPEGAVYAQPFQPYPMMAAPMYYTPTFGNGAVYYPPMGDNMPNFGTNWVDPTQQRPPAPPYTAPPMPHEQTGTMFYPDPSMQSGMMPMPMGYGFYNPMMPNFYPTQT